MIQAKPIMNTQSIGRELAANGFVLPNGQIARDLLRKLDDIFTKPNPQAGRRDLLAAVPVTQSLLADTFLCSLIQQLFDSPAFVVRATLFDKQPAANWSVTWHQDRAIAVEAKHDVAGYGPWSIKNQVHHVEPPVDVLERMTSIRLHLENCTDAHGPLVVSPRTHGQGRLRGDHATQAIQSHGEQVCCVNAGSVLVMKPLTLHRSSKMADGLRRRVIHLDCADRSLPNLLAWKYRAAFAH